MKPFLVALTALLLAGGGLSAQPGPDAAAWKKMNLSDEQKATLKDIRANTQKQMIDLRADLNKKRVDLRTMMDATEPDRALFERLIREIADLQVKQKLLLFDADREVVRHLDAGQQAQWKEIKTRRMQRLGDEPWDRGPGKRDRGEDGRGHRPMRRGPDAPPPPPAD